MILHCTRKCGNLFRVALKTSGQQRKLIPHVFAINHSIFALIYKPIFVYARTGLRSSVIFRNINTSVFSGPGVPAVLGVRGNRNPRRFLAFCRPKCPVGDINNTTASLKYKIFFKIKKERVFSLSFGISTSSYILCSQLYFLSAR